jgi:LysR family transcriptional activator of nhaA
VLPVLVCGAPKFAGLKRGFPESLHGQPFILPTPHGRTRHLIEDYFRSRGIVVKLSGEAQDGELLRRAALSGEALVPVSPSTIESEVRHGELVSIGSLAGVHEEVWLISTPRLLEHPVVSYLMRELSVGSAAA